MDLGLEHAEFSGLVVHPEIEVIQFIRFTKHVEVGATYEFPLSTRHNDIFDQRVTVSVILGL